MPIRTFRVVAQTEVPDRACTPHDRCVHRVDTFWRAQDSGLIHGDADAGPRLTVIGASQDACA